MRGQRIVPAALAWPLRIIPARAGPTGPTATKAATRPDHPRSCGANLFARVQISDIRGSSPLVRGQPCIVRCHPGISEDHPRSCGANCACRVISTKRHGSSPLVRGQHQRIQMLGITGRIIPARAGPTRFRGLDTLACTDHPRSCGANRVTAPTSSSSFGSSPLVRGQRIRRCRSSLKLRIIPARAGPTSRPYQQAR